MAYLPPDDKRRNTALAPVETRRQVAVVNSHDLRAVQTSLDKAARIRNPIRAWFYKVGANARVSALENSERVGHAAQKAADADAAAFDALIRRAERAAEFAIRNIIASDIENNRIVEERHKIDLDRLRRETERLEAERRRLNAKHGLEATKKFKPAKFELGQARYQSRIADSQVDAAVARAAAPAKPLEPENAPAAGLINNLDKLIEQRLADGKDTTTLTTFLTLLNSVLVEVGLRPPRGGSQGN